MMGYPHYDVHMETCAGQWERVEDVPKPYEGYSVILYKEMYGELSIVTGVMWSKEEREGNIVHPAHWVNYDAEKRYYPEFVTHVCKLVRPEVSDV